MRERRQGGMDHWHGFVEVEESLRVEFDILELVSHILALTNNGSCAHRRPLLSFLVITRLTVVALSGIVQSLRIVRIYMGPPSRSTRSLPLTSPRRRSDDIVYTKKKLYNNGQHYVRESWTQEWRLTSAASLADDTTAFFSL